MQNIGARAYQPPSARSEWIYALWAIFGTALATLAAIALAVLDGGVRALDWWLLISFFLVTGIGVSAGMHRYFSHKSFELRPRSARLTLAVAAVATGQGHFIRWVHDHRVHHQFTDRPGDPHSPYWRGQQALSGWRGLVHAHLGWLLEPKLHIEARRVRDLLADPAYVWIDRHSAHIAAASVALPGLIAYLVDPSVDSALRGSLWGGAVRMFLLYHLTWAINSIGHRFGGRVPGQNGEARNHRLLGPILFGDGWHANHHVCPRSARHGWGAQLDITFLLISLMARLGIVGRVVVARTGELARADDSMHRDESLAIIDVPIRGESANR